MNPYQALANAIVLQATRDYRAAMKKLSRDRRNTEAEATRDELLLFFRSGWFATLTDLDPELLIRRLDKEVAA